MCISLLQIFVFYEIQKVKLIKIIRFSQLYTKILLDFKNIMEPQQPHQNTFILLKPSILFLINGITALLGWNAVLSSFDYYTYVYEPYNVVLWFPIPLFAAYMIVGVLYNWMSRVKSYKFLVTAGIIVTNLSLILLFLTSLIFKDNIDVGFGLSLFLSFVLGFSANSAQLSFFAMINYLGQKTVSYFTIGTAISGLSLVIIRMIIVAIFGSDESAIVPICLFMAIAIVFNFFTLSLNLKFFKTQQYKNKIDVHLTHDRSNEGKQLLVDASNQQDKDDDKSYARLMFETFKAINPYPVYIAVDFIITFMLFPALTFEKKMNMNGTWAVLIFNLMYNIGDTVGKTIGDFRKSFNSYSILYIFLARLFFFYTIPVMDIQASQDDSLLNNNFFPFFNQLLFGITNGFVINASFILSFETSPDKYKKYAGVLGGLSLQFGIMIGTFLAIPLESLVDPVTS